MAKLTTKERNSLSDAMFGEPDKRKYPMPDKPHARNALARASEEHHEGNLSDAEYDAIVAKAHRVLNG